MVKSFNLKPWSCFQSSRLTMAHFCNVMQWLWSQWWALGMIYWGSCFCTGPALTLILTIRHGKMYWGDCLSVLAVQCTIYKELSEYILSFTAKQGKMDFGWIGWNQLLMWINCPLSPNSWESRFRKMTSIRFASHAASFFSSSFLQNWQTLNSVVILVFKWRKKT